MRHRMIGLALFACVAGSACRMESKDESAGLPAAVRSTPLPDRLDIGHVASAALIAPIDIDANPAGVGLPAGQGTYAEGAATYALKCALCHGARGEGQGPNPRLVGVEPRDGFRFGTDASIPKTIGNYWPYATTLYDYIHRAMPLSAPGSLSPNETYALVGYLLAENEVVPRTAVMNALTLRAVQMPARRHFVPDDRAGGQPFR